MTERPKDESLLPAPTEIDHILKSIDAASSVLGPIASSAISGFMTGRRLGRLEEAIKVFDAEFILLVDEIAKDYVTTEEFEDLAIEAFERIIRERDGEKVRTYGQILAGMAMAPDQPYDIKIDVLRSMEQLHPVDIDVIRAGIIEDREEQILASDAIEADLANSADSAAEVWSRLRLARILTADTTFNGDRATWPLADISRFLSPFGHTFIKFRQSSARTNPGS